MALRLYNTLTRRKEDFVPIKDGEVGIYACGVTVYDTCHIGHARSAINFDVITRYLRYRGYRVNYVKNFTETRKLPFPVVIDAQGKIAQAFGDVRLTPTAFLIDKQGRIIKRYLGNYDEKAFMATVEQALAS